MFCSNSYQLTISLMMVSTRKPNLWGNIGKKGTASKTRKTEWQRKNKENGDRKNARLVTQNMKKWKEVKKKKAEKITGRTKG